MFKPYVTLQHRYTVLPKVLAPLLMKGLTALVISMSTNLNVSAYNDILGNLFVYNFLYYFIYFYFITFYFIYIFFLNII